MTNWFVFAPNTLYNTLMTLVMKSNKSPRNKIGLQNIEVLIKVVCRLYL